MKQLLILSGKGGTGKTTVAGAFIKFASARAYADCDVDAPNLHLVMKQDVQPKRTDYWGLPKAEIDTDKCIRCDQCRQNCRFDAIRFNEHYSVDPFACEGCSVCATICPVQAITMKEATAGELMLYIGNSAFSTAKLKMGSGTSGKLVTEVKNQLKETGIDADITIIDGSPGIGCPVIASLSGVDMVLIVTEPSISGISDMERIIRTAEIFKTKVAVCVNKYNANTKNTKAIEAYCTAHGIPLVGNIPYDPAAMEAINAGLTIADKNCMSGRAAKDVYDRTIRLLLSE